VRVLLAVVLVIGAYLIGMFPTAHIVGRRMGVNPTAQGSRNPGASNVYRLGGRKAGVIVGVIDMLKGAVPAGVALLVAGMPEAHAVWVAAVAGHVWPVTRGFRGGKGVATAGGAGLVINPLIGLACAGVFLVLVKIGRIAALGSLGIALSYPVIAALVGRPGYEVAVSAGVASILVIRHQSNIRRMLRRDENRIDESGTAAA
jgi:glycerol-3-phosphate acyltransferase PlsY